MSLLRNPVLGGFYPDPSICRVGGDYYLVNSTFAYFPGIPVFHSKDLRRWRQIGNAIDRPGQLCFDGHEISHGLFAPTIRHNRGVFYILCTLIRTGGNFVITARDPAGPWSDPIWLEGADGIDPSIFFDDGDDGNGAWYTGSRSAPEGEAYPGNCEIYIQRMDLSLLEAGKNPLAGQSLGIWRGAMRDAIWPEGPHIYKVNGWYYLLYAEGGTALDHAVCVARARDIRGPWEGKKSNPVLTHRHLGKNAAIINAGHADLFDDPAGNWRIVLLASRPVDGVCPLGRETFMAPIFWEDGWPFVATKSGLIEETVHFADADAADDAPGWDIENACDHFNGKLPLHWMALRMPARWEDAAFSLTARPGALRLFARPETMRGTGHPAFVGRRLRHHNWAFSAAIAFAPRAAGDCAGIILLQSENWQYRLELFLAASGAPALRLIRAAGKDSEETVASGECPELADSPAAILAARCEGTALVFFYGKEQNSLKPFAGRVDGRILSTEYSGGFVGTVAGVFASGNGADTGNYADVLWAEYGAVGN
jgi:alpha-N-arabinofuranosidase